MLNIVVRCGLVFAWGIGCPLIADNLALRGGAHLTGTVRSISENGVVELASELAPEPLLLKPGVVNKIEFSSTGAGQPPTAMVELANGDRLPADIESLDDRQLTVVSPEAGRLEIPRAALKSLQLGILRHTVVYAGPHNLDEWTRGEGDAKNWTFEHDGLIANGQATASQTLALPQQFVLRFTLRWQAKQTPNFQVFFADPLKPKGTTCDRYYLQFGGAGVEIKREATQGKHFNSLALLNRTPNQYPDRELQVELRVNRKTSRMQLSLNGEIEGEFLDPSLPVPDGSGISLVSNAPNGTIQEIRAIEILELDDTRELQHSVERGDPQADSLISREEDRWDGHLMAIRKTAEGRVFSFRNGERNDLFEIPAADVATVFFGSAEEPKPAATPLPFVLRLQWDGALHVTSCQFRDNTVTATHPFLGQLTLLRSGIVSMEGSNPKTAPAP